MPETLAPARGRTTPHGVSPRAAVFDVDETLIATKSMFAYLAFLLAETRGEAAGKAAYEAATARLKAARERAGRAEVNRLFWEHLAGFPIAFLEACAERWYAAASRDPGFWIAATRARLAAHREAGERIVLLTGSADVIVAPIARELGADTVLGITLETDRDARATGRITGIQTIGEGKREALLAHLAAAGIAPAACSGYGDHESDLPFLDVCGTAFVVPGDPALERIAADRGWTLLEPAIPLTSSVTR